MKKGKKSCQLFLPSSTSSLRLLHSQLNYSTLLSIFRQVPTLLFPWISLYCLTNLNTILFLYLCYIALHKYQGILFRERNKKMLAKSTVRWKNLFVHCIHFILCPFEECCFLFLFHDYDFLLLYPQGWSSSILPPCEIKGAFLKSQKFLQKTFFV